MNHIHNNSTCTALLSDHDAEYGAENDTGR
jgi:hypothetical protein